MEIRHQPADLRIAFYQAACRRTYDKIDLRRWEEIAQSRHARLREKGIPDIQIAEYKYPMNPVSGADTLESFLKLFSDNEITPQGTCQRRIEGACTPPGKKIGEQTCKVEQTVVKVLVLHLAPAIVAVS